MPNSKRFRDLKSELQRLRLHLLPAEWDLTGSYSERKLDRTRAYRVLAHAEIESFVEDVALNLVQVKYNEWNSTKKPHFVIVHLVAASMGGWTDEEAEALGLSSIPSPSKKKMIADPDPAARAIHNAFDQFKGIVDGNNGIKEHNLKRLLMPSGITMAQLNPTWLADMNSFGFKRGAVAHSSRLGVRTPLNPRDEKQTVDSLVAGLKTLNSLLVQL